MTEKSVHCQTCGALIPLRDLCFYRHVMAHKAERAIFWGAA